MDSGHVLGGVLRTRQWNGCSRPGEGRLRGPAWGSWVGVHVSEDEEMGWMRFIRQFGLLVTIISVGVGKWELGDQ